MNNPPKHDKQNPTPIELLTGDEAQRRVEGLCREAEIFWTAFLVESKLWGVKPQLIELVTPDGIYLGKALKKDVSGINSEVNKTNAKPIDFGAESYLMVEPAHEYLIGTLLAFDRHGKLHARKFGEEWEQNENTFKDKADLMRYGNDDRMETVQLLIDLIKEDASTKENPEPSLKAIFEEHLEWAIF